MNVDPEIVPHYHSTPDAMVMFACNLVRCLLEDVGAIVADPRTRME